MSNQQITVVLASASPARLAVLRAAGIDPVVAVSHVDEDKILAGVAGSPPDDQVATLATAKADVIAWDLPSEAGADCVVIGCDSMLLIDGELQGKPSSVEQARERWAQMAGREGLLLTGHAVRRVIAGAPSAGAVATGSTIVRMGAPTPAELDAYIATGEPLAVAGALTIDGYGGWFVEGVDGDPSNVIGISLPLTRRLLADVGIAVTDLWRARPPSSTAPPTPSPPPKPAPPPHPSQPSPPSPPPHPSQPAQPAQPAVE